MKTLWTVAFGLLTLIAITPLNAQQDAGTFSPKKTSCAMRCEANRFRLTSNRVYTLTVTSKNVGDADSFTLHNIDPQILNIKDGETSTTVKGGSAQLFICTTDPGTGGDCDSKCADTGHGVRFSTSKYYVQLDVSCE